MNLSFTLDEKVLNQITPKRLIEQAYDSGVSSFELSPDTDVLELDIYKDIVDIISSKNLDLNYHIPYFANDIYELEYFNLYQSKLKEKYISLLNNLETFQENLSNDPIIVIHGSNYNNNDVERSVAMDNTLKFLDWFLNIITKRNLPFTVAVETLRKKELRNTFDNRQDIFSILNEFNTNCLDICWDLCHDKLNFHPKDTLINDGFLNKVIYTHIHGHSLKEDISHLPLYKSDLDYTLELKALIDSGYNNAINIELLSQYSEVDYLDDLFQDIKYLNKYF